MYGVSSYGFPTSNMNDPLYPLKYPNMPIIICIQKTLKTFLHAYTLNLTYFPKRRMNIIEKLDK